MPAVRFGPERNRHRQNDPIGRPTWTIPWLGARETVSALLHEPSTGFPEDPFCVAQRRERPRDAASLCRPSTAEVASGFSVQRGPKSTIPPNRRRPAGMTSWPDPGAHLRNVDQRVANSGNEALEVPAEDVVFTPGTGNTRNLRPRSLSPDLPFLPTRAYPVPVPLGSPAGQGGTGVPKGTRGRFQGEVGARL